MAQQGIEIHVGETATLNYTLTLGSVRDTVTVEASAVALESATTTVGQVIEDRQIQDTPLNGRNVMNLLGLAPGVVPQGATSGAATNNQPSIGNYTNPAGWSNYQIGGGIAGQNALNLDGAPLNVPIQNWVGMIPAQDSIREFRVDSNNISPEFGRYYGGVISFSTKSGGNDFHGSAYEYFRNTVLDANNFFNNQTNVARPPLEQNQYGVSLGGPVVKNKLFFFANWEGYANRAGLPYQARVPTAQELQGDFTADKPITNLFTGTQAQCNGAPNKVCPDPTAYYMANTIKYWALPNIPNAPEGAVNFSTNASSGSNSNQVTGRLDYSLTKHQLFARYSRWSSFDAPHRIVLNYSLSLPFGKGRHFLGNSGPLENRLVSGWALSSITTFQSGFPLAFGAQPNDLSNTFGFGGIRPNVISGCQAKITGSAQSRLNEWFNTSCYVQPPTRFSIGTEGRTDPVLRTVGINSWDVGLTKDTALTERFHLLFVAQFLNLFNRGQFGSPGTQVGGIGFGVITSQVNNPRQIQFALRLSF